MVLICNEPAGFPGTWGVRDLLSRHFRPDECSITAKSKTPRWMKEGGFAIPSSQAMSFFFLFYVFMFSFSFTFSFSFSFLWFPNWRPASFRTPSYKSSSLSERQSSRWWKPIVSDIKFASFSVWWPPRPTLRYHLWILFEQYMCCFFLQHCCNSPFVCHFPRSQYRNHLD